MSNLLPGTEVIARGLRWEVVYSEAAGSQTLYRLRCLHGALRGQELDLLTPFEKLEARSAELDPTKPAHLQQWRVYHQAFLLEQALGPSALLAAQPGRLRMAPYQLVPVMRALRMSRVRLMLADGVGLGKTVECGLVLAELIARRRAHRILIVSPAGPLLQQWREEMSERFGLRFRVLDRQSLQEIRYSQELGANPFNHEALGLISVDFAKQEKVLQDLERTQYDVVVIDECHHCTKLGTGANTEDSQRRRLAEVLAQQSDNLLLLTATPHDGYDPHFASLVELLDPSLVDGRGSLRGDAFRRHVVRRLKRHIKDPETGKALFKERQVHPTKVTFNKEDHPEYAAMQQGLLALIAPQLRRAIRNKQYGEVLAFISLLKRSVSTAAACSSTLTHIADRLDQLVTEGHESQEERKQRLRSLRAYRARLEKFGTLSFEEEEDMAEQEAEDMAAELAEHGAQELVDRLGDIQQQLKLAQNERQREQRKLRKVSDIRDGLRELAALAEVARQHDPKLTALLEEIEAIREAEPKANVLVYSEYSTSQAEVVDHLEQARKAGKLTGSILAISGDDDDKTRSDAAKLFSRRDDLVLVSTDATAEGLNLQKRCHHLVHVELPYNPNRLEQRNGRIDRFGQEHDPHVRYLYLQGTFEERLLLRLVSKYEKQRKALTFVPNTLGVLGGGDRGAVKLLAGASQEDGLLFRPAEPLEFASGEAEDTDTPEYREMLAEVERAFSGFDKAAKTNSWLAEAGCNAEEAQIEKAAQASDLGADLGAVDLLTFVVQAIRNDSTVYDAATEKPDGTWLLKLPPGWTYGLEEIPGYDQDQHLLRITTDMEQNADVDGEPVGFLGRAHPIVRRALDRVRNIQLGQSGPVLDRRVSVARGTGKVPELLLTYLGRVQSGAGREFERLVAVRVAASGDTELLVDPTGWSDLADPDRAEAPGDQWTDLFKAWGTTALTRAEDAATDGFSDLAQEFATTHAQDVKLERDELQAWLRDRALVLCGEPQAQAALPLQAAGAPVEPVPAWKLAAPPEERLSRFAHDEGNPRARRQEARNILELYKRRSEALAARANLDPPEVRPLGMLMLLPADGEV